MLKHNVLNHPERLLVVFTDGSRIGERYSADLSFCPNPVCTCANAELSLYLDSNGELEESNAEFQFEVDLLERTLSTPANDTELSVYDRNIGQDFVEQMREEDWLLLWRQHLEFKRKRTGETPDKELNTHFPVAEIEASGLMVRHSHILPFAEDILVELNGREYLFDDEYCLRTDCACTYSFVTWFDEKLENDSSRQEFTTIEVDYRSGKWKLMDAGTLDTDILKLLAKKLVSKKNCSLLEYRHNHLRRLYQLFKQTHHTPLRLSSSKVGRNEPCPCGSGQKYKKCCMSR